MPEYPYFESECSHKIWKGDSECDANGIIREVCQGCGKVRAVFGSFEKMMDHGYIPSTKMEPDGILEATHVKEEPMSNKKRDKPHGYWQKRKRLILETFTKEGDKTPDILGMPKSTWDGLQRRWKFGKFAEKEEIPQLNTMPSFASKAKSNIPMDEKEELYFLRGYQSATQNFLAVMNVNVTVGGNGKRQLEPTFK